MKIGQAFQVNSPRARHSDPSLQVIPTGGRDSVAISYSPWEHGIQHVDRHVVLPKGRDASRRRILRLLNEPERMVLSVFYSSWQMLARVG